MGLGILTTARRQQKLWIEGVAPIEEKLVAGENVIRVFSRVVAKFTITSPMDLIKYKLDIFC